MLRICVFGPPSFLSGGTSPEAVRLKTSTLSSPESTIISSCSTST